MRRLAIAKGLRLGDKGLALASVDARCADRARISRSIYCQNEEEIFSKLGVDYIPPEERLGAGYWETQLTAGSGGVVSQKTMMLQRRLQQAATEGKVEFTSDASSKGSANVKIDGKVYRGVVMRDR
jgi:hypothetical protein